MAGMFSMFPAFGRQAAPAAQPPTPPRMTGAPPSGANFPFVNAPAAPAAPAAYVPPSYLWSPMRMANDDNLQELMYTNPQLAQAAYENGTATAQAIREAYGQRPGAQPAAAAAAGGGGGGVTWDIPYGVDPTWYKAFTAEHDGKTPEDVYRRDGEYAVAHALADKAWGDQFYRTYNRPPSEYDWKASYYQRQNAFYGG
jgi:hypothetical protein